MEIHQLSLLQRILLSTDGTVTDLIALCAGEAIHVKKLRQELTVCVPPTVLGDDLQPQRVLRRQILLCGARRNFLYADSQFIFERFSSGIQRQLLDSDQPIGLLWKQERFESCREIIDKQLLRCPDIAAHFGLAQDAWFVARTYLVHAGGRPLGAITEQWPASLFDELAARNS